MKKNRSGNVEGNAYHTDVNLSNIYEDELNISETFLNSNFEILFTKIIRFCFYPELSVTSIHIFQHIEAYFIFLS